MFTGIAEAKAAIENKTDSRLSVRRPTAFSDIAIGSSICVSGVCLSVVGLDKEQMQFDVVPETLSKTTLGTLEKSDAVNVERALKADGRFEGHIVQGHVEGIAKVQNLEEGRLTILLPTELQPFVIQKGSITIDGISLTVAALEENTCTVALIPHTLENTTLGALQQGQSVNIETDILGKYILSAGKL